MRQTLPKEYVAAVKTTAMFSAVGDRPLRQLLDQCPLRQAKAGTHIVAPRQAADQFFVVLRGRVKIFKINARGDEQILHLYGPGESFGEAAMWAGSHFPAMAEAMDDVLLLVIPRAALKRSLAGNAELAMGMMAGLSAKLREFNRLIESLSLKEVPARLAGVLLEESRRAASRSFRLGRTKREIAAQIGTVAETLSRTLATLKSRRIIAVAGSAITILDEDALHDLAENG